MLYETHFEIKLVYFTFNFKFTLSLTHTRLKNFFAWKQYHHDMSDGTASH